MLNAERVISAARRLSIRKKKTQQQTKKTKKQDISGSGIMREIYLHDEKCLQMR